MLPIAIIPARGGSKRVPKKNIVDFHGKPMIAWTIEAAQKADCFSQIIVSTDSEEIADISRSYGAIVPFLRKEHADDHSTVSEATCWTVNELVENYSIESDFIIQMMANVPLKTPETIKKFVSMLLKDNSRSLISCFEPKFSPPHWAIEVKKDGTGHFPFNKKLAQRSQDLPRFLIPTGAIWGAHRNYLKKYVDFYGPSFRIFEMEWIESLDIDTLDELEICKALADFSKW